MKVLEGVVITNHVQLMHRIMHLNAQKAEQEERLKHDFKTLYYSLHPVMLLKDSLSTFASDQGVQTNVAKIGLRTGVNFVIGKILGKRSSVKGFLSSLLLEKVVSKTL